MAVARTIDCAPRERAPWARAEADFMLSGYGHVIMIETSIMNVAERR